MIKPIEKVITINNSDNTITNFWIKQHKDFILDIGHKLIDNNQFFEIIKSCTKRSLYIQTSKELDFEFIEVINYLWNEGINVYILTNKLYQSYKSTIVGKVLFRYSKDIKGELVLVDPNSSKEKGYISFLNELKENTRYVELNELQIKECLDLFVYKFWKIADYECIDVASFNDQIETKEPPFDVFPRFDNKNILCDDYICGNIEKKLDEIIKNSSSEITFLCSSNNMCKTILNKLKILKNEYVKAEIILNDKLRVQDIANMIYSSKDYELYVVNNIIYPMMIVDNRILILFTNEIQLEPKLNSLIILSENSLEIQEAIECKNNLINNSYKYIREAKLKEINEPTIVINIENIQRSSTRILEIDEVTGEDEVCRTLSDLSNGISNRKIDIKNRYSKIIKYSYNIIPKYRDSSLEKDKLYGQWKNTYDNIQRYTDNFESIINKVIQDNSSLFDNIIALFDKERVNTNNTQNNIKAIKTIIDNRCYKLEDLIKIRTLLNSTYEDYLRLTSNIEDIKEYKVSLLNWQTKKSNLENNINNLEKVYVEKISKRTELEENISNNQNELQDEINLKEIEIENIKANISNENDRVRIYFEQLTRYTKLKELLFKSKVNNKKNKDKAINSISVLINEIFNNDNYFTEIYHNKFNEKIDNSLKDSILGDTKIYIEKDLIEDDKKLIESINNLNIEVFELKELLEETKVKDNELKNNLCNLEKEIIKLKTSLEAFYKKRDEIGEDFKYIKRKRETKEIEINKYNINIVTDELPKIGVLYGHKSKRQLAITYWCELEEGILEAERLKAELVCEI